MGKMHKNEFVTDVSLVRRLLAAQFPQWAKLPIKLVASAGTDNALYRLGDDKVVRLPRIDWAVGQIEKDLQWLPKLAPHLPLKIPLPLAKGEPVAEFPWHWGIYQWLVGTDAIIDRMFDPCQAAVDLAQFITALQQIDTTGGPLAGEAGLRGVPLAKRDAQTREAIKNLNGLLDVTEVTRAWNQALQAPEWDHPPVWFHGDLLPGNLLFEHGRLNAVIDFSGLGVGDPACDLMPAWVLFTGESRDIFRSALKIDDATWARGRGQALSQALIFIPYYLKTNPVGIRSARHAIIEILADFQQTGS